MIELVYAYLIIGTLLSVVLTGFFREQVLKSAYRADCSMIPDGVILTFTFFFHMLAWPLWVLVGAVMAVLTIIDLALTWKN